MSENNTNNVKKIKKKGPIRFEAIIPASILVLASFLYFSWYFDAHLKSLIEWTAGKIHGAEVNVSSVKTSFIKGTFRIDILEVTNKEEPKLNLLKIGFVDFGLNWDALLRLKFVVDKASIEGIEFNSPRKSPGEVYPVEKKAEGPGIMAQAQEKLTNQLMKHNQGNVLGDALALLQGADWQSQLEAMRDQLQTEKRLKEMGEQLKQKNEFWKNEMKTISKFKDFDQVESEIQTLKSEKNTLDQVKSLKNISDLSKKIKEQYELKKNKLKSLESEVKSVAQYPKEVESLVKQDIDSLQSRLKIPELDMKGLAFAMFGADLNKYMSQVQKYKLMAETYIPKKKQEEPLVPPRRSDGKTYHFPITKGYPLFWLKYSSISSKLSQGEFAGDFKGELKNVTTSPKIVGLPTVLDLSGNLPKMEINGIRLIATVDHTKATHRQFLDFKVNHFPIKDKPFSTSEAVSLGLKRAQGKLLLTAALEEDTVKINWLTAFNKLDYQLEAKNKMVKEIVGNVLSGIPEITVESKITGPWSDLDIHLESNLARELGNGLKKQVQLKIDEAKAKVSSFVNDKIGKEKSSFLGEANSLQSAMSGDLKSNFAKLDDIKKRLDKELDKLKGSGQLDKIKDQGKKIFKGLKF